MFTGIDLATLLTNAQTIGADFAIPLGIGAALGVAGWVLAKARKLLPGK